MKKLNPYFIMTIISVMTCFSSIAAAQEQKVPVASRCHSDQDCQKPGMLGACLNAGKPEANCVYQEVIHIEGTVIVPPKCRTCNVDYVTNSLKILFPGMEWKTIDTADQQAKKLIDDLHIEILPAYVLSKDVEKDVNFQRLQQAADLIKDQYYLKPSFTGVSYLLGRKLNPGQLDLFFLLTQKDANLVLNIAKEILEKGKGKLKLRFQLVGQKNPETNEIFSPGGLRELNEDKLYACVDQYYPEKSLDYLSCRLNDINSLWWDDCLKQNQMDVEKLRACAQGQEAAKLLGERTALAQELQVFYAPVFLLENNEMFGMTAQTTANEILKLFNISTENK